MGWDDEVDRFQREDGSPFKGIFDAEDIDVALALVERNFYFNAVTKKREGYLAVNAPKWTANRLGLEVLNADRQLVIEGLGIELTAVKDYRFLGELLGRLLNQLGGQVFETQSLIATVKEVLATKASTGKTYGQELLSGALGASEYRKARFLHCAEDENIVEWVERFISEWSPTRLAIKTKPFLMPLKNENPTLKHGWVCHSNGIAETTSYDPISVSGVKDTLTPMNVP